MQNKIIRLIGWAFCILSIILFAVLCIVSYDSFVLALAQNIGKTDKIEIIKQLFSINHYRIIQFLPILSICVGILIIKKATYIDFNIRKLQRSFSDIIKYSKALPRNYKTTFGLLILSYIIFYGYLILKMPISYDEAWTYLNFTQHNLFVSLSYYPAPNNHLLHSVLTNIFSHLPFQTIVNLRLPNFTITLFSIILLFLSFSKSIGNKAAMIVTILFSSLYPIIFYGYCSRGYALIILAFIISFHGALHLLDYSNIKKKHFFYFGLGGVIGLFSIPSFVYGYASLTLFLALVYIINKKLELLKLLILQGIITSSIVCLWYMPLMIVSGIDSLIKNKFVSPINRLRVIENLYDHFDETSTFIFNMPIWFFLLILVTIVIILSNLYRNKYSIYLSSFVILISPIIIVFHSVIPFPRTWVYLVIPTLYIFGLIIQKIKLNNVFISFATLLIFITNSIFFFNKIQVQESFSYDISDIAKNIIDENIIDKTADSIYCNHPLADANLLYEFKKAEHPIDLIYSRKPFENDTLFTKSEYDFLVLDKKKDIPGYSLSMIKEPGLFYYVKIVD